MRIQKADSLSFSVAQLHISWKIGQGNMSGSSKVVSLSTMGRKTGKGGMK